MSLIAILSVVSVSAATFGTTYRSQYSRQARGIQYASSYSQMPTLSMSSTGSAMMQSGSALPMAAVSGTTTADQNVPSSGPKRAKKEDDEWEGDPDPELPGEVTPIGDATWSLMMMALAFCGVVYLRRKKRTLNG